MEKVLIHKILPITPTHILIQVGKWHLGHYCPQCLPQNRGFDTFYGYLTGAEDYYKKTFCIRIEDDQPAKCGYDFYSNTDRDYKANGTYSTYQFRNATRELIDDHVKNHAVKPFFLYLPFQSVHYPLMVPKIYEDLYPNVKDTKRRTYLGMVSAMDEAVGGIVDKLKASGIYENTVFFYTTDNGGLCGAGGRNAPFRGQKATLWQGGLRVPAFMSGINVREGETYSNIMHITDIQMTILDMIDHKRSGTKPLDGVSHWDNLKRDDLQPAYKFPRNYNSMHQRLNHKTTPREEILLNIDRFFLRMNNGEGPDPQNLTHYPNPYFNTSRKMASWSLLSSMPPSKSRIRHILWLFNWCRRLL
jgi:arylsulfatase A-like enzyme